jgi:hypothetical protein
MWEGVSSSICPYLRGVVATQARGQALIYDYCKYDVAWVQPDMLASIAKNASALE